VKNKGKKNHTAWRGCIGKWKDKKANFYMKIAKQNANRINPCE
jgi:hypothetical protein